MDSPNRIIAVLGASGVQGGSVITAILAHPVLSKQFHIRALSRNLSSISSKPWSSAVPDRQYADIDDPATLSSAFANVHTVFGVNNYWEHLDLERDIQQGRNIADAARAAGVSHLIWSAQYSAAQVKGDPSDPTRIDTLDGKAAVMEYIEATKAQREPPLRATYPIAGFYMQNLPKFMVWPMRPDDEQAKALAPPEASDDAEVYVWRHPWSFEHTQVPLIDATDDTGLYVAGILLRERQAPGSMDGKKVHCVSEWSTPKAMVEGFARAMNGDDNSSTKARKELRFIDVETEEAYRVFLPEFLQAGLPPCMARFRDYPLFGPTGPKVQAEHDRVFDGVGRQTTSWEEYVRRRWETDWHG